MGETIKGQILQTEGRPRLKKCPHCGKEDSLRILTNTNKDAWLDPPYFYVYCDPKRKGCGASGGLDQDERKAIEAWNRRMLRMKDRG